MPAARLASSLGALVMASALCACQSAGDETSAEAGSASSSPSSSPSPAAEAALTATDLEGRSYTSTSVDGWELVDGTTVSMIVEPDVMSVSAGCNTLFGDYELDDGVLRWSTDPAQTLRACSEELTAQDAWLADLLVGGVDATSEGDELILSSGDVTLRMRESTSAPDLSSVLGRTWTVVGTIAEGETQRTPRRNRLPRLYVGDNGLSRLDTGCNTGRTLVRVVDANLRFGPTSTTRQRCPEPDAEIERRVLAVLDGDADTVKVEGDALVVTKGPYGLVVRLR